MRRYWIEKNQIDNDTVTFKNEQFHHIFDVCRQETGHQFEVITEDSKAYLVEVISVSKKMAQARLLEERLIPEITQPHIHLAISLPRYAVIDSVIERAVEMGVHSIHPFVSDFSQVRKIKDFPEDKYDRWKKIVVSATQQCGRGRLMTIHPLSLMDECLQRINPPDKNWCLFAYEGPTQTAIDQEIKRLKTKHAELPDNLWIIVGSEGGFSEKEVSKINNLGLNPVTLGPQVMRVETACLTLVSVLKYEFGLMK